MPRTTYLTAALLAAILITPHHAVAQDFPPGADPHAAVEVSGYESWNEIFFDSFLDEFTSNSLTNTGPVDVGEASAEVNLDDGTLRGRLEYAGNNLASGNTSQLFSTAVGREFIQFDTGLQPSSTISYTALIDGVFRNTDSDGYVSAWYGLNIYDVTGQTTFFQDHPNPDSNLQEIVGGLPNIESNSLYAVTEGTNSDQLETWSPFFDVAVGFESEDGSAIELDRLIGGTFEVFSDRTYLVELSLNLSLVSDEGQAALMDFGNTATLRFTDLDGAALASSSGTFLTIPEPSSLAVLALGGVFTLRRRGRGWA